MSEGSRPLHLGDALGVEVEYQIVDPQTGGWKAVADRLLRDEAGEISDELAFEDLAYCNELAAHVLEIKCPTPRRDLGGMLAEYRRAIAHANTVLEAHGGRLLPGGAHPFESPADAQLWPHAYSEVYHVFDRLFGCQGHGWVNLQSTQINLSFQGDEEFERLHTAIRCVLPLLPALAASTPFLDGVSDGNLDRRMRTYAVNSRQIPIVTAQVIPEPFRTQAEYQQKVFDPIALAVKSEDPNGVLDPEFVNSRGAIARFSRGSIEIRTLDAQECPSADLAILWLVDKLVESLVRERWSPLSAQRDLEQSLLLELHDRTVRAGDTAEIEPGPLAAVLGLSSGWTGSAGALWRELVGRNEWFGQMPEELRPALDHLLEHGCLAGRMLEKVGTEPTRDALSELCLQLCDCLANDAQL